MRYTFVKQHDATDCAAACLAMICLHYKKETTITNLRDKMGTDLKGTNLLGLSKCAEQLGFVAQAVRVDREGFESEYTLPAIANILTKEGLSHFVVVFKVSGKYVIVGDPAKDLIRMEIDEFYKSFTGAMQLAQEIYGHAVVYYKLAILEKIPVLDNLVYSHTANGVDLENAVDEYQAVWETIWNLS